MGEKSGKWHGICYEKLAVTGGWREKDRATVRGVDRRHTKGGRAMKGKQKSAGAKVKPAAKGQGRRKIYAVSGQGLPKR